MKKIILTVFLIFVPSMTTIAFSSPDIPGEYIELIKDKDGDSGGTITIKQSTKNEYDVEIASFSNMRQDGFTYNYCATLSGKGKIIDGVLVLVNTAKESVTDKTQNIYTNIYLNKHPDVEKFIDEHKKGKNSQFAKKLSRMTTSQIAILEIAEPINSGYMVSGKEECDRGGGIGPGIFTKSGKQQATTSAAPATRQTAAKPSFDCAKATNAVERAICSDPMLAAMDVSVAADYKKALNAAANKEALKAEQRQWLQQMHSQCSNGAFQCIQQHYRERLSQLKKY